MAAKIIFLIIIFVMLICSCTLDDSTNQSDFNSITNDSSSFTSYPTEYTGTILAKDYLGSIIDDYSFIDGIESYEVIIPEDGVLLLTEQESLNKKYIDGDVYITYSADVSFHNVFVTGKVYCHGTLRASGESRYSVFTYYAESQGKNLCGAYDGSHGQLLAGNGAKGYNFTIGNDVLDYAFEKWENFGSEVEYLDLQVSQKSIEPQIVQHGDTSNFYPDVYIFSGEGRVTDKIIRGDVYITSEAIIEFEDVQVLGNIYCYGQLKFSNYESRGDLLSKNNSANIIYAYKFNDGCDSFDGVHGLIVGGPIRCQKVVISDDALDYAFETFGKQ